MNKIITGIFVISLLGCLLPNAAQADFSNKRVRAGISIGAIRNGGASISADAGPVLNDNISAGFEFFGLNLVSIRALMWEQPANMSGFNGGPKLYLGFGSRLAIEPGAEVGWLYRMKNRIDVGAGIDLVFANSIGGSIKISAGLLF